MATVAEIRVRYQSAPAVFIVGQFDMYGGGVHWARGGFNSPGEEGEEILWSQQNGVRREPPGNVVYAPIEGVDHGLIWLRKTGNKTPAMTLVFVDTHGLVVGTLNLPADFGSDGSRQAKYDLGSPPERVFRFIRKLFGGR